MLEGIKANIEKLIALYEGEKHENERLREELEKSGSQVATYQEQITDLERQVDNLKLAAAFSASLDNDKAAKERIMKLIKEIDRCIKLLEK